MTKIKMKVENLKSSNGNKVANQFEITTSEGCFFQSYKSLIVFIPNDGSATQLDCNFWDYSATTSKYRNLFLGEKKEETEKKIKNGEYLLTNLNPL
jgi:hypothetical protein